MTNKKPKAIRSKSKTTFTIEISSEEESRAMQTLNKLNGIPVTTTINNSLNICKGLVYVYNYNMAVYPAFRRGLMEQHGLQEIIEPHWIKSRRNILAKPLLLTFRDQLSQYIDIPGEITKTMGYEYKDKPLMCKTCLEYGHSKNRCTEEQSVQIVKG